MNKALNMYQTIWLKRVFEPCVKNNPNASLSYPFFFGVSDKYAAADKKLMIVGQETRGWSIYKPYWTIEDSQKWAINYLNYQLDYSNDYVIKYGFVKKNTSPFWNFFKLFSKDNIVPCWNNIDKAQRCINGETFSLTQEIELELNKILPNSEKTLFQKEIEIVKPDVIVFVTGPNYYATMEAAMNLEKDSLCNNKPSHASACVEITEISKLDIPTFWTYHPNHINHIKELSNIDIANSIKEGFCK